MLVYVVTASASAISAAMSISRSVGVSAGPPLGLVSAPAEVAFSRPPNASEPATADDPIDARRRNDRRSGFCGASVLGEILASGIRAPEGDVIGFSALGLARERAHPPRTCLVRDSHQTGLRISLCGAAL